MRPWIRSLSNPNTLTRMPPTQYPLSGKAAPPPNSRDVFPSLQQGADPLGWTQGDPREPQGAQGYRRAPSAPLGGMGPRGPLGLYRSHSEWNPVSTGRYLRREGHIPSVREPFEWKGRSEWMALPNGKLCHVFTQPRKRRTECRRIWSDFDGFEWIWMDLIDQNDTKKGDLKYVDFFGHPN